MKIVCNQKKHERIAKKSNGNWKLLENEKEDGIENCNIRETQKKKTATTTIVTLT